MGNVDARAKNISFYSLDSGLSPAPTYGITALYALESKQLDRSYAMAIGDALPAEDRSGYEWSRLAEKCGLPRAFVRQEFADMAAPIQVAIASFVTEADSAADRATIQLIAEETRAECSHQLATSLKIAKIQA